METKLRALAVVGGLLLAAGAGACGSSEPPPPQPPPPVTQTAPPPVQDTGDAQLDCTKEPTEHLCRITIAKTIYYDTDKDTIRPESYPVLQAVANVIHNHPDIEQLIVEGHTDNQGSVEHNRDLSEHRAHAVVRFLHDQAGVTIPTQSPGYGATVPICFTEDDVCKQMNRRVEFKVKRHQS